MAWIVVRSLNFLLAAINAIAPNRDKSSDGSIGDTSHSARPSGHNPDESGSPEDQDSDSIDEVRARDFDKDLRRPGLTMEMICQHLVAMCRSGEIRWIKYIIFDGHIWSASSGFRTRAYTGSNPHDKHMHVSSKPDTGSENDTTPLRLESLVDMPLDGSDETKIRNIVRAELAAAYDDIAGAVWLRGMGDPEKAPDANGVHPNSTAGSFLRYLPQRVGSVAADIRARDAAEIARDAAVTTALSAQAAVINQLVTLVEDGEQVTLTDEQLRTITGAVTTAADSAGAAARQQIAAMARRFDAAGDALQYTSE